MLREYRGDGFDNCGIPAGMDFITAGTPVGMMGELTGCDNLLLDQQYSAHLYPDQDHYWRPLPTIKCYNLHTFTIVIITKYIYIFLWRPLSCGIPWATAQFPPLKSGPV